VTDQIPEATALAQVTAALQNADGTQNVYITQDPARNVLTLTLRNGLSDAIAFSPGAPVAYENLPPGQSAVYIFLNGLIDNADIAAIHLFEPGWAASTFTDSSSLQYLVIAPASTVTVQPGALLTFQFAGVLVSGSPRSGTADILLAGATSVTSLQSNVPMFVNIASPPPPGKKKLDVQIGFDTPVVYTGQPQSLTLHLVNSGQAPLVPGGTSSWHGITPTFQLALVYGDDAGALTTVARAAQIAMDISDGYGNVWQPPRRHVQGQSPYWIMQPDPDGGGTVLGTGEQAIIEFVVTGIEATLPAGPDSAITIAYVSWHDIPGYDDGSEAVTITKRAGPTVSTFTADPPTVPFGQPSVQTVLTWNAAHATGVRFDAPQVEPSQTFWTSGSGPIEGGIDVPRGTTLTLTAYKDDGDDVITATARLRITGASRTDVSAGIGSLGGIVIPAGSARAFLFQMNVGSLFQPQLTHAAILDLSTHAITGTLDLGPLIPSKQGETLIHAAVPGPDGTTIHVLASSRGGAGGPREFYIVPLYVASASYGKPVFLGKLVPSGQALLPQMLATPDGRTVYVTATDLKNQTSHTYAVDVATYTVTGSWNWQVQPDEQQFGAVPVASSADGSILLMVGWTALTVIDVAGGFTEIGTLNTARQFHLYLLSSPPVASPDATRAYCLGIDNAVEPSHGSLLAVDVDLATGALTLAKNIPLGLIPALAGPAALSPDAKTLYMLTAADVLTAYDTTAFTAVPYSCGINGQFTPLVIASGAQPAVLYSTGGNGQRDGTVSIVTVS
jgi:hypothetical protein